MHTHKPRQVPFRQFNLNSLTHNSPGHYDSATQPIAPIPRVQKLGLHETSPDANSRRWSNMPSTSLDSSWVEDYPSPNSTEGSSSQENQCGPRFEEIDATDEMRSFFRNAFYKSPDKPRQTKPQGSAQQMKQDDDVLAVDDDMGSHSDSDRNSCSDRLDGHVILPELIKLTLAQHRMILSLRDVNKEAVGALKIINARLDLVEEELTLVRSSLADQTEPSLFSGVGMSSSFEDTERDTADDYVPAFDLTDIGATLATGPGPGLGSESGCSRYLARESSLSSSSSKQRRRSPRPERYVPTPTYVTINRPPPLPDSRHHS